MKIEFAYRFLPLEKITISPDGIIGLSPDIEVLTVSTENVQNENKTISIDGESTKNLQDFICGRI